MSIKIFAPEVADYLHEHGSREMHPVLAEMQEEARVRGFPIIGPEVGRVMRQLCLLRKPKRILELGSGYGYSAVWWSLSCGGDVAIDCTEFDARNIEKAYSYAEKAGVRGCITYHQGDALESARKLDGPWDIILCDIDKLGYPQAWEFMRERLRPGDVFLFDNMLWSGRVARGEEHWDDETPVIRELTDRIYADKRFATSLLPIRDGVLMGVRV